MIKKPAHANVFFICSEKYHEQKIPLKITTVLSYVQSESLILVQVHVPISDTDRISGRESNPVASPRLGRAWSLWCPLVRTVRAVSSPHRSPSPRSSSSQTKHSHLAKPKIVSYPNQTFHTQPYVKYFWLISLTNFWQNLRNILFLRICFQSFQGKTSKEIENFLLKLRIMLI